MDKVDLSIILPALSEDENLQVLLPQLQNTLRAMSVSFEILVIGPSSHSLTTKSLCEKSGALFFPRVVGNS